MRINPIDRETAAELNGAAVQGDHERVEEIADDELVRHQLWETAAEFESGGLSEYEAFTVAGKAADLRHKTIAVLLNTSKISVDQYSQRARGKYLEAELLVDMLERTSVPKDWEEKVGQPR